MCHSSSESIPACVCKCAIPPLGSIRVVCVIPRAFLLVCVCMFPSSPLRAFLRSLWVLSGVYVCVPFLSSKGNPMCVCVCHSSPREHSCVCVCVCHSSSPRAIPLRAFMYVCVPFISSKSIHVWVCHFSPPRAFLRVCAILFL